MKTPFKDGDKVLCDKKHIVTLFCKPFVGSTQWLLDESGMVFVSEDQLTPLKLVRTSLDGLAMETHMCVQTGKECGMPCFHDCPVSTTWPTRLALPYYVNFKFPHGTLPLCGKEHSLPDGELWYGYVDTFVGLKTFDRFILIERVNK